MSERLFIDTSGYVALIDPRDDRHVDARGMNSRFQATGIDPFTTTYVLSETHALLIARLDRDIALRVIERIYASNTHIIRPTEGDERQALETLRHERD